MGSLEVLHFFSKLKIKIKSNYFNLGLFFAIFSSLVVPITAWNFKDNSTLLMENLVIIQLSSLILTSLWIFKIIERKHKNANFYAIESLQENYENAQKLAKIGIWEINAQKGRFWWSKEIYRMFDIDPVTPPSELFEIYKSRLHRADKKRVFTLIDNALKSGEGFTAEHRIVLPDGTVRFIQGLCHIKLDPSTGARIVYGVAHDISEIRKVESNLFESQRVSKIGSWYLDIRTGMQTWSTEHYNICEVLEPQDPSLLFEIYRSRIHAEDLPRLEMFMKTAIEKGMSFVYDHRIVLEEGKRIKYVRGEGKVHRNEKGEVFAISGTCRDRTEEVTSEAQYQSVLNSMNEGLVVQDSEGRIINFNPAALRILSLSEKEILGLTSYDPRWKAIREDGTEYPGAEHPAIIALKTGRSVEGATMGLRFANGETRWLKINAVPLDLGGSKKVICTFSDMTQLVQAINENRFILDSLGIGIFKFNPKSQSLVWDQSMFKLFEINESDFTGHYEAWESSLDQESKAMAVKELELALRGEKEFDTTFEIKSKSGSRKQIGGRARVVRNEKNEPIMMYGINWDRTRECALEKSLQIERAKSIHNAKLASMGEMSAGVAHEINNPLAIIVGNLGLLGNHRDNPEKFEAKLLSIKKAAERIAKIVKGLRKFSRSSEGLIKAPHDLGELIQEAIILTEAKAQRNFVSIGSCLEGDLNFLCDPLEIEQVFVNLINNSIDAISDKDGKWIRIQAFRKDHNIVIQFHDSGNGISDEVQAKLFQPFFTTKPVGQGTGLGLSIVKGILDQHKASIHILKDAQNTCFELVFPIEAKAPNAA